MSDTGNMETAKETRNTPSRDADAELGKRAHMLLWGAGRKQGDVAAEIGISSGSLGLKLKGQRGWALSEVMGIARALNTTVAYLTGETDEPLRPAPIGALSRLGESNSRPSHYKVSTSSNISDIAAARRKRAS